MTPDNREEQVREAFSRVARCVDQESEWADIPWDDWLTIRAHIEALEADLDKAIRQREHSVEWYAVRWERIRDFAKEHGWRDKAAAILANGTLTMTDGVVYEPPTYAQQLNMAKHRAEAAEARVRELEGAVPTNWCDPLLTGENAALTGKPGTWGCPDIESLLRGIKARMAAMQGEEVRGE